MNCWYGGTLLQQGAEALVYECEFLGQPAIAKFRFSKKYRHIELDKKLTRKRNMQEARALLRCSKIGIDTPAVYFVDLIQSVLVLEYIESAQTLKEYLFRSPEHGHIFQVMETVGQKLAVMHNADIIHGDLTSSNILVEKVGDANGDKKFKVIFIDFGLSSSSRLVEDKAVDLYVLEKAFHSTHPNSEEFFDTLMRLYKTYSTNAKMIISKFEEVKQRGRKRTMVG